MTRNYLILALVLIGGITTTSSYAEFCVESNSGQTHCFPDNYNSNDVDYSYGDILADKNSNYHNIRDELFACGGYLCGGHYDYEGNYVNYNSNSGNSLDNGCYVDTPYLWSDGYCYSYPELNQYDDDVYNSDYGDSLDNGCYVDTPYLWSDGYCYSYPELNSYDDENISFVDHLVDKKIFHAYDSKGNYYSWTIHTNVYEDLIINGYNLSESNNLNPLHLVNGDGTKLLTTNLDGFVYGAFESITDDIYANSDSNSDFIYEVWYIVSQFTDYDLDRVRSGDVYYVGDEGRYALDTLSRGGGDCEDLVILVADMLVSSKHTKDWTIQYVYMDGDNPNDPQTVNHVILYVNDGTYDHYIEATGEPSWDYYPDRILGWFFDV